MTLRTLRALSWTAGIASLCVSCGSADDEFLARANGSVGGDTTVTDAGRTPTDASAGGSQGTGGGRTKPRGAGGRATGARGSGATDTEGGLGRGGSGTGEAGAAGGSNSGGSAGAPASGGSAGVAGSGGATGCANPAKFFPDQDGDHYGRSTGAIEACSSPAQGTWATVGGDCNDDNVSVHPGQTQYFDVAFPSSGATDSFDYDCSNHEDGDGAEDGAAPSCASLLGIGCTGTGFAATTRTGAGTNPLCGSKTRVTCQASALACVAATTTVSDGYRCR